MIEVVRKEEEMPNTTSTVRPRGKSKYTAAPDLIIEREDLVAEAQVTPHGMMLARFDAVGAWEKRSQSFVHVASDKLQDRVKKHMVDLSKHERCDNNMAGTGREIEKL